MNRRGFLGRLAGLAVGAAAAKTVEAKAEPEPIIEGCDWGEEPSKAVEFRWWDDVVIDESKFVPEEKFKEALREAMHETVKRQEELLAQQLLYAERMEQHERRSHEQKAVARRPLGRRDVSRRNWMG